MWNKMKAEEEKETSQELFELFNKNSTTKQMFNCSEQIRSISTQQFSEQEKQIKPYEKYNRNPI